MRERVVRLNGLMAETISPEYFAKTWFAAYTLGGPDWTIGDAGVGERCVLVWHAA